MAIVCCICGCSHSNGKYNGVGYNPAHPFADALGHLWISPDCRAGITRYEISALMNGKGIYYVR